MQPLTEKQTQRVWSRVMSAQTAPAAAMENPAPAAQAQSETLTPEKLLSLIDGERADSALYAHLAARMKGRAQAMLRAIAPALMRKGGDKNLLALLTASVGAIGLFYGGIGDRIVNVFFGKY